MPANYTLLEKITVGAAGASSVTFSNIPQTGYTDLLVKVSARSTSGYAGENVDDTKLNFNNNTSAIYSRRNVEGNGSATQSANNPNGTFLYAGTCPSNAATASTFGNYEVYIPNYTSSSNKSMSIDVVSENNATKTYAQLQAGLWANTSAINRIDFGLVNGSFVEGSTFYLYGVAKLGTTPAIVPYATGGDTIMTDGTYWYHAFKSSGTFTPAKGLSCDVLVVAGGGSGGTDASGGGGAGGVYYSTGNSVTTTGYTVTIGAGGAGVATKREYGNAGSNSQFGALTAAVGGGPGTATSTADGGSGGGKRTASGGAATSGQGNIGGGGVNSGNYPAGGGGGAGGAGGAGVSSTGGAGGAGTNTYSTWLSTTGLGVSGYIAGGGGGGVSSGTGGAAGSGGATAGVVSPNFSGNATANTGSGSGGAGDALGTSGNGGSGLVIVRYAV